MKIIYLLVIFCLSIVLLSYSIIASQVNGQECYRSVASFGDISDISTDILYVQFEFEVTGFDGEPLGFCGIQNISDGNPEIQTDSNLWGDIASGLSLNNSYDDFDCSGGTGAKRANLSSEANDELDFSIGAGLKNWSVGVWLMDSFDGYVTLDNEAMIVGYSELDNFPILQFETPTPANNTKDTVDCIFDVNMSIVDESLAKFIFQLEVRPSNYALVSNTADAMKYNFENLSSLSETQTLVVDVATDSENNDGIITGTELNETDCKFGKCRMFDGNDQIIPASPTPGHWHDEYSQVSYEVWVHPWDETQNGTGQTIWEEGGGFSGSATYINNSELIFCLQNAGDLDILTTSYPNDKLGHQLAFKYESSNMSILIDGNIVASQTTSFASVGSHGSDPTIGLGTGSACDLDLGYFKGNMDEFYRHANARHEAYLNMSSHMTATKINSTLWDFNAWDLTGYWDNNQNWNIFQQDNLYYYNASATDTSSQVNVSETRWWQCGLDWCNDKLNMDGDWKLNNEFVECLNEVPIGRNLTLVNSTIALINSTLMILPEETPEE